ncbi:MAG: hypothetical protein NWF01_06715 [Candidatus Bathyarchaeota archaeon]|nr:hypothetical protein [Candidatus Bathyarchaeota archaeon]
MDKKLIVFASLFFCFLLVSTATYLPVADAIAPLIILAVGLIIGGVIGGTVGFYVGQNMAAQDLIHSVGWQYVSDTAINYGNLVSATTNEFRNEAQLSEGLTNYFSRKAEIMAQYYVNESTFPYEKVLANSGILAEYLNLTNTIEQQSFNVANVSVGHARETFTGDLSDFNVYALTQEQLNASSGYYQLVAGQYYNLKTHDYEIGYANITDSPAFTVYGNASSRIWETDAFVIQPSSAYTYDVQATPILPNPAPPVGTTSTGVYHLKVEVVDGNGNVISNTRSHSRSFDISAYGYSNAYTGTLTTTNQDVTIGKIRYTLNDASHVVMVGFYPSQPVPVWEQNIQVCLDSMTYTGTQPQLTVDEKEVLRVSYRINDSPYIEAGSIDFKPLQSAVFNYSNVLISQVCSALETGKAYWQALRDMGYRSYVEVEALMPFPDLVLPENIFDLSGTDFVERYAMYAAYLQSLKEWFQSNSTYVQNIGMMNISNVNFSSIPACAEGRIYFNATDTWTEYCGSIWIVPQEHNVTLTKGQNCTLGVLANICYQLNSTGEVAFAFGKPADIIEVQNLYVRNAFGIMQNTTSVTIGITDLYTYTIEYTNPDGIDFPDFVLDLGGPMVLLIAVLVLIIVVGYIQKKPSSHGRRYSR